MIFGDEPPYNWANITSREGDTDDTVPLLPFQRSFMLVMIDLFERYPDVFFEDFEDINLEDFHDKLDDMRLRLAF